MQSPLNSTADMMQVILPCYAIPIVVDLCTSGAKQSFRSFFCILLFAFHAIHFETSTIQYLTFRFHASDKEETRTALIWLFEKSALVTGLPM